MRFQTLHPNHMFLSLVKSHLAGFYGRLPGYEMNELKPGIEHISVRILVVVGT